MSGNYKKFYRLLPRNSTILYAGVHMLLITGHMGLLTSCILILVFSVGAVGFICNRCLVTYISFTQLLHVLMLLSHHLQGDDTKIS